MIPQNMSQNLLLSVEDLFALIEVKGKMVQSLQKRSLPLRI